MRARRPADAARVVAAARGWLGTPYHHQASRAGVGTDCLGLLLGVWREVVGPEPERLPPYTRDWGEIGPGGPLLDAARRHLIEIDGAALEPGAVVLFRMRRRAAPKHCGIVTGTGAGSARFIHAWERAGVVETELSEVWRRRIAHVFLFPGAV